MIKITEKSTFTAIAGRISVKQRGSQAVLAQKMAKMFNPTRLGTGFRQRVSEKIARRMVEHVREQISDGRFVQNSPVTRALKGSDTPLQHTGKLLRSLMVSRAGTNSYRVTFRYNTKSGFPIAALAAQLELGRPGYQMTDQQKRWLKGQIIEGNLPDIFYGWIQKGYVHKQPARPFFERALRKTQREIAKLVGNDLPEEVISAAFESFTAEGRVAE